VLLRKLLASLAVAFCYAGLALAANTDTDTGIEGVNSQEWSVGIFFFLMVCIVVFTAIVIKFMRSQKLKTGEKVLFAWILLGIIVATVFGALQLLQGRLF